MCFIFVWFIGTLTSSHNHLGQGHANYLAAVESLKAPAVPNNMKGVEADVIFFVAFINITPQFQLKLLNVNIRNSETFYCPVSGCFSFCLFHCSFDIIPKTEILLVRRQAFGSNKHGFLRSEENVNLNNFPTLNGVWVLVCPVIFIDTVV